MADSAHNWQFVHSATSMIMFHFFIGHSLLGAPPLRRAFGAPQDEALLHLHRLILRRPLLRPSRRMGDGPNHFAGTSCAASSARLISASSLSFAVMESFSIAAKVSDMCSMRPSHSSTCTIDCAPASECVVLVWV